MVGRKTRQKIKDHMDSAINHLGCAVEQLNQSMEMGEERSPECFHLIPKIIETIIEVKGWVETVRSEI